MSGSGTLEGTQRTTLSLTLHSRVKRYVYKDIPFPSGWADLRH